MAKKSNDYFGLHPDTEVELIATKGDVTYKQITTYKKALNLINGTDIANKKKGWSYRIYQIGHSQFKNAQTIN